VAGEAAKTRDAERSRRAILAAAEQAFAAGGFAGASLGAIADAAGVSRGTPSYFYGSKDGLYQAVLEGIYADRNARLEPAFARLGEWAEASAPAASLRGVLGRCVGEYLDFLRERPTFVDIMEREALDGGTRLAATTARSAVMEDAFAALRRRRRAHGLRSFDVDDAVLCLVGLAYTPVAQRATMLRRRGLSIDDPAFVRRRKRHIVDVLLFIVGGTDQ
jgi:TetR/AcrR family transcriptional regulator